MSGEGSVPQGHEANQGGQRDGLCPFGREHHHSRIGVAGWKPPLIRDGLIQHRMPPMKPRMRL